MVKKVLSKVFKKKNYPRLAYASIIKRVLGFLIDNIFILAITTIITNIATDKYYFATGATLYILFMIIYLIISSKFQGTIGKIVMHMKVTDLHGHRIKWWRSIIRFLIGLFYLGDILILFTKRKQTLKDFISGTVVVDKKK